MSDQKQTPITAEWLLSVGFENQYDCLLYSKPLEDGWYVSVFWEGNGRECLVIVIDGHRNRHEYRNFTQERLSALWFALTGEEL